MPHIFPSIIIMINYRKPLSFHSVSFGRTWLSGTLRGLAQIALEVQNSAPNDPLLPAAAKVDSSYAEALDTVCCNCLRISPLAQVTKFKGSTRGDFPWNCRVIEKAEGFFASLNKRNHSHPMSC